MVPYCYYHRRFRKEANHLILKVIIEKNIYGIIFIRIFNVALPITNSKFKIQHFSAWSKLRMGNSELVELVISRFLTCLLKQKDSNQLPFYTLKSLMEEQTRINEQALKKVPPCLLITK